ncbi:hypothetical protein [uncultured Clostridium sp.]|uniref:hypothetical protein n=1 Tax=uncultured Clostridium sp. TaxID=59620 RepID=UPI0027318650|nr:hypothetical protein [uncultured Clostridium sp.]
MKIECISTAGLKGITVGKIYKAQSSLLNRFQIINDYDLVDSYPSLCFEVVKENHGMNYLKIDDTLAENLKELVEKTIYEFDTKEAIELLHILISHTKRMDAEVLEKDLK